MLEIAGRVLRDPLCYVAPTAHDAEAGTIVTSLEVGGAARASDLPYWPSYTGADPSQRAAYLDWMASGRTNPEIAIGYAFIFFYGLEWRALVDREDQRLCMAEVVELVQRLGSRSRSFAGYAHRFLVFLLLERLAHADEAEIRAGLGVLGEEEDTAVAGILAWYHDRGLPLPDNYAMLVASHAEDAKRSVVLDRAASELRELFSVRYRERHGAGLVLAAASRALTVEYHPASASLARSGFKPQVAISNVLGRPSQLRSLVNLWNQCIDDLRKLSTKRGGQPDAMTPEIWEALPAELRRQTDHPDQDRWTALVAEAPRVGSVHLIKAGTLANLAGVQAGAKVSAAQLKKAAQRAEAVGFAVEPDPRVVTRGAEADSPVAIWRSSFSSAPDPAVYVPARNLLTLLLGIAAADESIDDRELDAITTLVEDAFVLDEPMRVRLTALREVLLRSPVRAASIAKKLKDSRTPKQLESVGRMLVAVAAVDGILAEGEHKALRQMFRALGLQADDLDAALVHFDLRSGSDQLMEVRKGSPTRGEAIRPPLRVALDAERIAQLTKESEEVSLMLAEILDADESDDASDSAAAELLPAVVAPLSATADDRWSGLDLRYHAIASDLVSRAMWPLVEARELAKRHHLMLGGVVEAINTWSEDAHGDALIEENDDWTVNEEIAARVRQ